MKRPLPQSLTDFVDKKNMTRDFGTATEYALDPMRKDFDRQYMHGLSLQGAQSAPAVSADEGYFEALRARAHTRRAT